MWLKIVVYLWLYADDVVFYVAHESLINAKDLLQADCDRVYKWFTLSGPCINTDETQIVLFIKDKRHAAPDLSILMGNTTLTNCDQCENLGVILDYRLNLDAMVCKTISIADGFIAFSCMQSCEITLL